MEQTIVAESRHRILTIEKGRIRMEVKGAQARQIEEREG
jgi:hypothetical protein